MTSYEKGLLELDRRSAPLSADVEPAYKPRYQKNHRLDNSVAAGGGLVTDEFGNQVPHYWGHRERLRQRFLKGGSDAVAEYEVLEMILFNAIQRIDVKPLAKRLLAEFGNLNGVVAASESRILKVEGATSKVVFQLEKTPLSPIRFMEPAQSIMCRSIQESLPNGRWN